MGKFVKTCLIVGAICIVAGIIASGAGIFNGGLSQLKEEVLSGEWTWNGKDNFGIAPFFELEKQNYFNDNENLNVGVEYKEEKFSVADVQEMNVKSAGVTVEFVEHDGEDIIVGISNVDKYQGYVREGELYIVARGKSSIELGRGSVQLMIPAAIYDTGKLELNVESAASVVDLKHLVVSDVELEISAGTITWSELQTGELKIEMSAGTVTGENTVVSGSTDIGLSAGTVNLNGVLGTETDIEMLAGLVNISLADAETDYNYDVSCAGGSVTIGNQASAGLAKTFEIKNNALKNIDVECSMGAVNISFTE